MTISDVLSTLAKKTKKRNLVFPHIFIAGHHKLKGKIYYISLLILFNPLAYNYEAKKQIYFWNQNVFAFAYWMGGWHA